MNISKSIRVALAMRGMTQGQLAKATKIHQSNISKMMNGKYSVSDSHLQVIADAVDMKVSELIALGED